MVQMNDVKMVYENTDAVALDGIDLSLIHI